MYLQSMFVLSLANLLRASADGLNCTVGELEDDEVSLLHTYRNARTGSDLLAVAQRQSKSTPRRSEFLAIMPNSGKRATNPQNYTLHWLKIEYPVGGASTTSEVSVTEQTNPTPELGNLHNLDIGLGPLLGAKIFGDNLYMYVNRGVAPIPYREIYNDTCCGCCADTMRVYPKDGSNTRDIDLEAPIQQAIGQVGFPPNLTITWDGLPHASHTFTVSLIDGTPHAFCLVQYSESKLDNAITDAIVAINLVDGTLKSTADGELYFNILEKVGTLDDSEDSTRFKLQFVKSGAVEQWHANGIQRFTTRSGMDILAFAVKDVYEAIVLKDPWTYTSASAGGAILQRFGCPKQYTKDGRFSGKYRSFGIDCRYAPDLYGIHNIYHNAKADGTESFTIFANSVRSDNYSHAYDFDLKFVDEHKAASDDVFKTVWNTAAFTFLAPTQGGARSLGNGVWIGAGGSSMVGYQIVDRHGETWTCEYDDGELYDPFTFIRVPPVA